MAYTQNQPRSVSGPLLRRDAIQPRRMRRNRELMSARGVGEIFVFPQIPQQTMLGESQCRPVNFDLPWPVLCVEDSEVLHVRGLAIGHPGNLSTGLPERIPVGAIL